MREKSLRAFYSLLMLFPSVCYAGMPSQSERSDVTVFLHVNIISMETERVLKDQTVLVQGGRILRIAPSAETSLPKHAAQIDGSGKYCSLGWQTCMFTCFHPMTCCHTWRMA
jgi:hypothetical protein